MIYPEQRGDFFPKMWNETEFNQQFDLLMDAQSFVATTEKGFIQISLVEKIAQFVKNLFGGTDYSKKQRVQAAWLKFLYYGEAQKFLKKAHIDRLHDRLNYPIGYFDPAIKKMAFELENRHLSSTSTSDYLNHLREIVIDYHNKNTPLLTPGIWRRIFTPPLIDTKELKFYGDTPILLSEKAIAGKIPNPQAALNYLQQATQLKNDSPDFQEKIAQHLEKLEDTYSTELIEHKQKIQSLWILLGQTAFENDLKEKGKKYLSRALTLDSTNIQARIQIGKTYLLNKEYSLVQPLLPDLQKFFAHDIFLQIEMGHAYWQDNQFEKGLQAYESALNIYQKQPVKQAMHQKSIASVYHLIGISDLTESMPHLTTSQKLLYLTQAVQMDGKNEQYQENLCQAYVQESKNSKENFPLLHGQELLKASNLLHSNIIQKNKSLILSMLLECGEHHFKTSQNQKGHIFLKKALALFNDADVKTLTLDLALHYSDWSAFETHFIKWRNEHPSDPFLKEKIGDAYWQSNKPQALKYYQESLDIFDQRLFYCTSSEEKKDYEHHIANIQARIGQTHLESTSGFWKNIPYDQAIVYLEKANALQPNRYASILFDACLAAAQAEQKKFWSNSSKVIAHYHKAFQINAQKGDYLIDLFQLCMDNQQHNTAIAVYKSIRETTWAKEFNLPPAIYNEIAQILLEKNEHEAAIDCLKHAYEADPNHKQYKQEYFQQILALAQKDFQNLKNNVNDENDSIQKLNQLSENLEASWKGGAESLNKLGQAYSDTLIEIYQYLSQRYLQRCLLPDPAKIMGKELVKEHKKIHEKELLKALFYYDKAISIQPENAALHFDKGVLLDWGYIDFEQALTEFNLAIKYQDRNPFYHKLVTTLYMVVNFDAGKQTMHEESIKKYGPSNFNEIYETWRNENMYQQNPSINPHSYTKPKGWFG